MKTDTTLTNILAEVVSEIQDEKGVELSMAEVNEIASSQFSAAIFAFIKGIDVQLPHFGRFERVHKEQSQTYRKYLASVRDRLTPEEFAKEKLRIQKMRLADNKARSKSRKTITLKKLLEAEYSSDIVNVFQKLNKGDKVDINDFFDNGRRAINDKLQRSQDDSLLQSVNSQR